MGNLIIVSFLFSANPNIGFGVGQTLGEHLLMPSLFTMRIGVREPFVIAPEVDIEYSSQEAEIDSTKDTDLSLGVECNLHYAFLRRGKTKFCGIFGVGANISKEVFEWYEHEWGDSLYKVKQTTTTYCYGLNLGLGMEQFLTDNLSIYISSLSNISFQDETREKQAKGETQTIHRRSGYCVDFQNLKCCIYLIWYLQ